MYIEVKFSEDMLFGDADTDDVDVPASVKQFAEAVENHIHSEYPNAEIKVTHGNQDVVKVDGFTDLLEARWVDQMVDLVWDRDDWLVYK